MRKISPECYLRLVWCFQELLLTCCFPEEMQTFLSNGAPRKRNDSMKKQSRPTTEVSPEPARMSHRGFRRAFSLLFFCSWVALARPLAPAPSRRTLPPVLRSPRWFLGRLWMPRSSVVLSVVSSFGLGVVPWVRRPGRPLRLVHLLLRVELVLHAPVRAERQVLGTASRVPISGAPHHPFTSSSPLQKLRFLVSLSAVGRSSVGPLVICAASVPPGDVPLSVVLASPRMRPVPGAPPGSHAVAAPLRRPGRRPLGAVSRTARRETGAARAQRAGDGTAGSRPLGDVAEKKVTRGKDL